MKERNTFFSSESQSFILPSWEDNTNSCFVKRAVSKKTRLARGNFKFTQKVTRFL